MKKTNYVLTSIFVFAIITAAICCGSYFIFAESKTKTFAKNTIVGGIDVSGLNLALASEKLNEMVDSTCIDACLTLVYGENEWHFGGGNFTANSNSDKILSSVLERGKSGSYFSGENSLDIEYVFNGMEDKLEEVFLEIEKEPQDAGVVFSPNQINDFEITNHVVGVRVDREALSTDILRKLKRNKKVVVSIPTYEVMPNILTEDVVKYTQKQGEFSTDFSKSSEDRKENIRLAFSKINGYVLQSGEEFSFNDVVGERTVENGFKEAKVILAGEYENGIGGGICQASTTLYNAIIRAGLDVTEVKPHSLPPSYVPLSLDAMVSWGYSDLKFVNNSDGPVYIKAVTDNSKITVTIYGNTLKPNQKIQPRAELVKTLPHLGDKVVADVEGKYQDKIMFKGEYVREKYPYEGYESKSYLDFYEDGKVISSTQIRNDIYNARQGLVYEGVEELPEGMTLPANSVSIIPPQAA